MVTCNEFKVAQTVKSSRDRFPLSQSEAGKWKPQKIIQYPGVFCFFALLLLLLFVYFAAVLQSFNMSMWPRRYNSSRTSSSSLCDGHGRRSASVCACSCHVSSRRIGKRKQHIISREVKPRRGQGDINQHFLGISKAIAQPRL